MSIGKGVTHVATEHGANMNSTGVKITYGVLKPVYVQRVGFVTTSSGNVATAAVLTVKRRVTAGDSGSDETLYTLSPSAAVARGKGVYKDADDRYLVKPGEQIIVELTSAGGTTSTADVHLEVEEYPFVGSYIANMTEET